MRQIDQGLGAAGLIALATALAVLISIGLPITFTADPIKLSDWLGFAGNVLGAGVTLTAAFIAWRAVQTQIAEQRRSAENQRRDAANLRFNDYLNAIRECHNAYTIVPTATNKDHPDYKSFELLRSDPRLLSATVDPIMGGDSGMVALLLTSMHFAIESRVGNERADPLGRYNILVSYLYPELFDSFETRRRKMAEGSVDDLTSLTLLNRKVFFTLLETGRPPIMFDFLKRAKA